MLIYISSYCKTRDMAQNLNHTFKKQLHVINALNETMRRLTCLSNCYLTCNVDALSVYKIYK